MGGSESSTIKTECEAALKQHTEQCCLKETTELKSYLSDLYRSTYNTMDRFESTRKFFEQNPLSVVRAMEILSGAGPSADDLFTLRSNSKGEGWTLVVRKSSATESNTKYAIDQNSNGTFYFTDSTKKEPYTSFYDMLATGPKNGNVQYIDPTLSQQATGRQLQSWFVQKYMIFVSSTLATAFLDHRLDACVAQNL